MSYASKRSVAKAQGMDNSKNVQINKIRHRGMQKGHLQITPDGKVIQHYKMDQRTAHFMKAFKKTQAEAAAKKEEEAKNEEVQTETETKTE